MGISLQSSSRAKTREEHEWDVVALREQKVRTRHQH